MMDTLSQLEKDAQTWATELGVPVEAVRIAWQVQLRALDEALKMTENLGEAVALVRGAFRTTLPIRPADPAR